jgi:hypothetical protein
LQAWNGLYGSCPALTLIGDHVADLTSGLGSRECRPHQIQQQDSLSLELLPLSVYDLR